MLRRLLAHQPGEVATSVIVAHELYSGAAHSSRPEDNRRRLELLFEDIEPLPFLREDAEKAGAIRARLRALGMSIGPCDVLIAGQALARGLTLVTGNSRKFVRVDGLMVTDWGAESPA